MSFWEELTQVWPLSHFGPIKHLQFKVILSLIDISTKKKTNVAPLSLSNHSCFTQVYVRYDNLKIGKQKEQTLLSGDLSEDIVMDGD